MVKKVSKNLAYKIVSDWDDYYNKNKLYSGGIVKMQMSMKEFAMLQFGTNLPNTLEPSIKDKLIEELIYMCYLRNNNWYKQDLAKELYIKLKQAYLYS